MEPTRVELVWPGKTSAVERVALPFQIAETINRSRASRARDPLSHAVVPPPGVADWTNKLIWGDNKPILASLIAGDPAIGLEPLAGKVDLIYIDPPFASGQDFSYRVRVGDETWQKEANLIEEKAYRDTWGMGMESYLQMMHERLTFARELLSPTGSIYLHCDYRVNSHLRLLLDEVMGPGNMRNEIVTRRQTKSLQGQFDSIRTMNVSTDTILWYSKQESSRYTGARKEASEAQRGESWHDMYNNANRPTMQYELLGVSITRGQWRWSKDRALMAVANYDDYVQNHSDISISEWWEQTGESKEFVRRLGEGRPQYWIPPRKTVLADTNWFDIFAYDYSTGYDTEKSEALLERVIKASSNEGDLVLDFFAGSGTTLAVAEKLGRRWIGCDLSRYAIQVTRKRMLDIDECRPFQLLNLGRYERRHWQVNVLNGDKPPERAAAEYYRFIISLYRAEPAGGHRHLHGRKAGRMVHVGPADAPVTRDEIMEAVRECAANRLPGLDVLGWEWELGLHDVIVEDAKAEGVDVRLLVIPREVMDKRAVEKGDVKFHELAYLRTSLEAAGRQVVVKLDDFIIPNPELVPDEVRSRIKKWSDYIDFWAVDWNYGAAGEGDAFHNEWQTYRTRSAPALILLSEPHVYAEAGTRRILVKVIDIFGNDATQLREVELR